MRPGSVLLASTLASAVSLATGSSDDAPTSDNAATAVRTLIPAGTDSTEIGFETGHADRAGFARVNFSFKGDMCIQPDDDTGTCMPVGWNAPGLNVYLEREGQTTTFTLKDLQKSENGGEPFATRTWKCVLTANTEPTPGSTVHYQLSPAVLFNRVEGTVQPTMRVGRDDDEVDYTLTCDLVDHDKPYLASMSQLHAGAFAGVL